MDSRRPAKHAEPFALSLRENFAEQADDLGVALGTPNGEQVEIPFEADIVFTKHLGQQVPKFRGGGKDSANSIGCTARARCRLYRMNSSCLIGKTEAEL